MCDEEEDAYQKKCSVFVAEELGLYVLLSLLSPLCSYLDLHLFHNEIKGYNVSSIPSII